MKALVPCHSSTPKSLSKSSVIVYHGISCQPVRSFRPWISAWGARETNASVVSRAFKWAGCATWSARNEQPTQARSGYAPPPPSGYVVTSGVEGAVDDQLAATLEQVEKAHRARRAVEA